MRQSWIRQIRAEPQAAAALAIFVIAVATLGGAWFFQYVLKYPPCPLCLEERIPYHVIIPLSLLMTVAALAGAPQKLLATGFVVIGIAVLWGAGLSVYHSGVEWHFWQGPTDCSGPLTDIKSTGALLSQLQKINVVRCDQAAWRLFGISLAGYNALISLLMAAIVGYALLVPRARTA
jgi:disulfide bond formation protein DsbB